MSAATTILILHTLGSGTFWPGQIEMGIKSELEKSGFRGQFETVYLPDTTKDKVLERIDRKRPDTVVITNEPVDVSYYDEIASKRKIPVFFASIPKLESELTWMVPANRNYLTGVLERTNINKSVTSMERITGKTITTMGILVGGPSENMQNLGRLIRHEMNALPNVKVTIVSAEFYEEWQQKIVALDKENDITVPLLPYGMKTKKTNLETDWKVIDGFMTSNLLKPTIGIGCMHTPIKRTLSLTMKPRTIGIQVGRMLYEHLIKGISISRINIEHTKFFELEVSGRDLKRLGLKLPLEMKSYATIL